MKTLSITIAALVIAACFSSLLIRLNSQDREIQRQRDQIAVLRETSGQAREDFDRMLEHSKHLRVVRGWEFPSPAAIRNLEISRNPHDNWQGAMKDLDAEIETLEAVSKER